MQIPQQRQTRQKRDKWFAQGNIQPWVPMKKNKDSEGERERQTVYSSKTKVKLVKQGETDEML